MSTELNQQAAAALAALEGGDPVRAARLFESLLPWVADHPELAYNLGNCRQQLGEPALALAAYDLALNQRPDYLKALFNRGNSLRDLERLPEALACFRQVLCRDPALALAYNNLGSVLTEQGRDGAAERAFRLALGLEDCGDYRFNLAHSLLRQGCWAEGWHHYEGRWWMSRPLTAPPLGSLPRWPGDSLAGRSLLVWAEQGLGDTLQFCRYLRWLPRPRGPVWLRVPAGLVSLCRQLDPELRVIADSDPLPASLDCHIPLLSLPGLLEPEGVPRPLAGPYLRAEPCALPPGRPGLRIGLVWGTGRRTEPGLWQIYRRKSLPLAELLPAVAGLPGQLYSLQLGEDRQQLQDLPPGQVIDLAPQLTDFAATAAAMAALDGIVSVDTAACHLAAALGKPTFTLLCFAADWRWQAAGEETLWYPTMRLLRQRQPGDWASALADLPRHLVTLPPASLV